MQTPSRLWVKMWMQEGSNIYEIDKVVDLGDMRQHWEPRVSLMCALIQQADEVIAAAGEEEL